METIQHGKCQATYESTRVQRTRERKLCDGKKVEYWNWLLYRAMYGDTLDFMEGVQTILFTHPLIKRYHGRNIDNALEENGNSFAILLEFQGTVSQHSCLIWLWFLFIKGFLGIFDGEQRQNFQMEQKSYSEIDVRATIIMIIWIYSRAELTLRFSEKICVAMRTRFLLGFLLKFSSWFEH